MPRGIFKRSRKLRKAHSESMKKMWAARKNGKSVVAPEEQKVIDSLGTMLHAFQKRNMDLVLSVRPR